MCCILKVSEWWTLLFLSIMGYEACSFTFYFVIKKIISPPPFRSTNLSARFRCTPQTFLRSPNVTASHLASGRVGLSRSAWTACCNTSATLRCVPVGSAAVTRTSPNVCIQRPRLSRPPAKVGAWSACATSRRWEAFLHWRVLAWSILFVHFIKTA